MIFATLLGSGLIGGVIIGAVFGTAGWWLGLLCSILVCFIFPFSWFRRAVVLCTIFLGIVWSLHRVNNIANARDVLGNDVGWGAFTHEISGTIRALESHNQYRRMYRLHLTHIDSELLPQAIHVALVLPPNLTLNPGDIVEAKGRFSFPKDTGNYAAEKYLWHQGMIAEFHVFHHTYHSPQTYSLSVRMRLWFDTKLKTLFPEEGYQLLSGILLGQKQTLDPLLQDHLRQSGLMHIVVVSGSNVIMIIIFLSLFLRFLPALMRIIITISTITFFVLVVGGDVPVIRAAIMGIVGYSVHLWGYKIPRFLLPTGVASVFALWNPLSLAHDIGLQLSFMAVICMVAWSKMFSRAFHFLGSFFSEAAGMTLAATLGTLPFTVYYFGSISVLSLIANLFAAPAIPVLMYGGIITVIIHHISHTISYWIGYIPWMATTYLLSIIHTFGSQTWSVLHVDIEEFRGEFLMVSLALLFAGIVYFGRQK